MMLHCEIRQSLENGGKLMGTENRIKKPALKEYTSTLIARASPNIEMSILSQLSPSISIWFRN